MIDDGKTDEELEGYLYSKLVLQEPALTLLGFLKRLPSRFLRYYVRCEEDLRYVISSTLSQYGEEYERVELIFSPKTLENQWLSQSQIVAIYSKFWLEHPKRDKR